MLYGQVQRLSLHFISIENPQCIDSMSISVPTYLATAASSHRLASSDRSEKLSHGQLRINSSVVRIRKAK